MNWQGFVRASGVALVAAAALGSGTAHAQNASGKAAAQALFDDGKKLMSAGNYAEACPKLAASQEADPGAGTLLNLAACYEKLGKTASAWVTYTDAVTSSQRSNHPDWAKKAQAKVDALKPTLVSLSIGVTNPPAGFELTRDGAVVGRGEWNTAIPVDPGGHDVAATASGKKPWKAHVEVDKAGQSLAVPALEDNPAETSAPPAAAPVLPPPQADAGSTGTGQRVLGLSLVGVGVVGAAIGTVFGIKAMSSQSDADKNCVDSGTRCNSTGFASNQDAHSSALISTVGFIAGGALLAGGAVIFFTAPKHKHVQDARFQALPGGGVLSLRGSF